MDLLVYSLSSILGGFALGFILLSYFAVSKAHIYLSTIAVAGFLVNTVITALLYSGTAITILTIISVALIVLIFAIFIVAAYFGRKFRIYLRHKK